MFGEHIPPTPLAICQEETLRADCILLLGTAATVYPAASLPEIIYVMGKSYRSEHRKWSTFCVLYHNPLWAHQDGASKAIIAPTPTLPPPSTSFLQFTQAHRLGSAELCLI